MSIDCVRDEYLVQDFNGEQTCHVQEDSGDVYTFAADYISEEFNGWRPCSFREQQDAFSAPTCD